MKHKLINKHISKIIFSLPVIFFSVFRCIFQRRCIGESKRKQKKKNRGCYHWFGTLNSPEHQKEVTIVCASAPCKILKVENSPDGKTMNRRLKRRHHTINKKRIIRMRSNTHEWQETRTEFQHRHRRSGISNSYHTFELILANNQDKNSYNTSR